MYYIAEVRISPNVRDKIMTKHNISEHEIREAFQVPARLLSARWDWSEEQLCWRLLVVGVTYTHRTIKGVLYPTIIDDEIWWLGTAFAAKETKTG